MRISSRRENTSSKTGKIIQFNGSFIYKRKKAPNEVYNYRLTILTDAGVSFSFKVPIYDICMVSDVANYKACNFPNKDKYIPQLQDIANAYGNLLKELGIGMISYRIDKDDEDDTAK